MITGLAQAPVTNESAGYHVVLLHPEVPGSENDKVLERLHRVVAKTVVLPNALPPAQRLVAAEKLDVLVFGEVGMDRQNYFLAFSRLAHRSALFWGHAVTSGITRMDVPNSGGGGGGGIDYFVSSELFEASHPRFVDDGAGGGLGSGARDPDLARAQRRYTERLYLMRSLTTSFQRPPSPTSTPSAMNW